MFRENSYLKTLAIRKKLLLAESELNRVELLREVEALQNEAGRIKKQVFAAGTIVSSGALIATAVSLFRGQFTKPKTAEGRSKSSWISDAFKGARVGTSLYFKIKSLFSDRD